jgi:hypothetical protein
MTEHSEEWLAGFAAAIAAAVAWLREERDAFTEMERVQGRELNGAVAGVYDVSATAVEALTPRSK